MKYRKIGLRMCIISIIMITLCIPNQIQIANAAVGDTETSFKIWDNNGDWSENGINNLNLFPEMHDDQDWSISPGDYDDYTFFMENNLGYEASCEIRLEAQINARNVNEATDKTYPITYQLYRRKNDTTTKLLGTSRKNPLDYPGKVITHTEKLKNGEKGEYILSWMFEQVDSTFKGGNYNLTLKVNVEQATNSGDNTTPTNPDDDNKNDNNKGDNNNSTDNGNSGNNSSNNNGNSTSNNNKGNNTNGGTNGNDSSNNNQGNNQNNKQNNLNIDKTSSK